MKSNAMLQHTSFSQQRIGSTTVKWKIQLIGPQKF